MKNRKLQKARIEALLLTDGTLIEKYNKISFANTSETLINRFRKLLREVFGREVKVGVGKGRIRKLFIVQLTSKRICSDLLRDFNSYVTSKDHIVMPESWSKFTIRELRILLRDFFDTDGGCSLRVSWRKERKCFELERTIFLSSRNDSVRKLYKILLKKVGIRRIGETKEKLTITNKEDIKKFAKLIGFSPGVRIGYDSKHWVGIEKRNLLRLIVKTYEFPKGFLQTFNSKREIISFLRSLLGSIS